MNIVWIFLKCIFHCIKTARFVVTNLFGISSDISVCLWCKSDYEMFNTFILSGSVVDIFCLCKRDEMSARWLAGCLCLRGIKRRGCWCWGAGQMSLHLFGSCSEMSCVSHYASGIAGSGSARSLWKTEWDGGKAGQREKSEKGGEKGEKDELDDRRDSREEEVGQLKWTRELV